MRLAEALKQWRESRHLSLEFVASAIGISTSALSRFENRGNPDGATLALVLRWMLEQLEA